MDYDKTNHVFNRVRQELENAIRLHPHRMHNGHEAHSVILEELEEFWDFVKTNPAKMDGLRAVDLHPHNMGRELVQTAAMAIRAILDLELSDKI